MLNLQALIDMTDAQLAAATGRQTEAVDGAWRAWAAARDAGADLHAPEFQAFQRLNRELGGLLREEARRREVAALAMFAPEPMSGPEAERAWREGPGSEP